MSPHSTQSSSSLSSEQCSSSLSSALKLSSAATPARETLRAAISMARVEASNDSRSGRLTGPSCTSGAAGIGGAERRSSPTFSFDMASSGLPPSTSTFCISRALPLAPTTVVEGERGGYIYFLSTGGGEESERKAMGEQRRVVRREISGGGGSQRGWHRHSYVDARLA